MPRSMTWARTGSPGPVLLRKRTSSAWVCIGFLWSDDRKYMHKMWTFKEAGAILKQHSSVYSEANIIYNGEKKN